MEKIDTTTLLKIKKNLGESATQSSSSPKRFFKTEKGEYAAHDVFIGVPVPKLRVLAKKFEELQFAEIKILLESSINEERFLALLILIAQYKKGDEEKKLIIYQFYLDNIKHINNWNLVDGSAPYILGPHLLTQSKDILFSLAHSSIVWERRIAIVTTWYFIRNNEYRCTLELAKILLKDQHDLIQKAVGWMLRELGKRDKALLKNFLIENATHMPRTMLRYAIEKFPEQERKFHLKK